ncbi:isoprenylcysteine carboxyl methyltransferase [Chlorella sorokiniana]|uniref:Isoprenylcysteine carboxyl methyltransferase n=1 Tax=Chlorella sorokiniana TaxID=3076 RepID=A0A2P6TIU1_CHLSO|nr:isoprenylcysteine carboxyl methyltransferase [Chlorella sorokiniana]|eukprot:PRW39139.1 isoprenylcysteine carboxyl methyltransferase [Chlorella sorokiniana]
MLRYGRLAEARRDVQRSIGGARLSLLLFAAFLVPAGHWAAWWDPSLAHLAAVAPSAAAAAVRLLPLVGYSLMLAGWALNAAAAAALGKAYNRVVAPDELVTSGPYALVQHPIYTSYMLLFAGHALSLGSPAAAGLLLAGCLWYYSGRTRLEEAVLESAFGERYRHYRSSTGRFLPRLR